MSQVQDCGGVGSRAVKNSGPRVGTRLVWDASTAISGSVEGRFRVGPRELCGPIEGRLLGPSVEITPT